MLPRRLHMPARLACTRRRGKKKGAEGGGDEEDKSGEILPPSRYPLRRRCATAGDPSIGLASGPLPFKSNRPVLRRSCHLTHRLVKCSVLAPVHCNNVAPLGTPYYSQAFPIGLVNNAYQYAPRVALRVLIYKRSHHALASYLARNLKAGFLLPPPVLCSFTGIRVSFFFLV
ncbi:hypothetical protein IF1G_00704 [Cordyceps javanica]|uniref:Uncharacterized protein n=1 Tax=Cordyceps javanica TaxID=43265 RepID=A0A545VGC4_9HYPO|nr:hypothetical protein IF1G_00704 [Cordyceps javanica]